MKIEFNKAVIEKGGCGRNAVNENPISLNQNIKKSFTSAACGKGTV